jgi:hypothetical protein
MSSTSISFTGGHIASILYGRLQKVVGPEFSISLSRPDELLLDTGDTGTSGCVSSLNFGRNLVASKICYEYELLSALLSVWPVVYVVDSEKTCSGSW